MYVRPSHHGLALDGVLSQPMWGRPSPSCFPLSLIPALPSPHSWPSTCTPYCFEGCRSRRRTGALRADRERPRTAESGPHHNPLRPHASL
eukprot:364464-Chlamydomonas_euryale.AAC.10